MSPVTGPTVPGRAISRAGTGNAGHYFKSLILHGGGVVLFYWSGTAGARFFCATDLGWREEKNTTFCAWLHKIGLQTETRKRECMCRVSHSGGNVLSVLSFFAWFSLLSNECTGAVGGWMAFVQKGHLNCGFVGRGNPVSLTYKLLWDLLAVSHMHTSLGRLCAVKLQIEDQEVLNNYSCGAYLSCISLTQYGAMICGALWALWSSSKWDFLVWRRLYTLCMCSGWWWC